MSSIPERAAVEKHFDHLAEHYDVWKQKNSFYHTQMKSFIKDHVPPGHRVLEVGCGTGEMLAATEPDYGVGIDISAKMIGIAAQKFPHLKFLHASAEGFESHERFDFIIMVDLCDHVPDMTDVFKGLQKNCHAGTRIILTTMSPLWNPVLFLMEKLKAKMPEGPHRLVSAQTIRKKLEPLDLEIDEAGFLLLCPADIPFLSRLANTLGVKTWGLRRLSSIQYAVIRPSGREGPDHDKHHQ